MARSEAYIVVSCDKCGVEIKVELEHVANEYWREDLDENGVARQLDYAGWQVEADGEICEVCADDTQPAPDAPEDA